jgi:Ca2+-binding RTX toxin-like protein
MHGLGGDDAYVVDSTADKIVETAGKGIDNISTSISYQLGAGVSVETLRTVNAAATTAINLAGNELANAIAGNAGSNMLFGYAGKDSLTGGAGNDFFVFNTALNAVSNVDSILDFNVAQDTIRLDNGVFTALGAGPFTAGMFTKGAAAIQADDRIVYNSSTGALIYDTNGNAAGGATQFATLSKGLALTYLDFQII